MDWIVTYRGKSGAQEQMSLEAESREAVFKELAQRGISAIRIEQYGRRLVARQDSEIAIFTRTSNEIEQAVKRELGKGEIAELVDKRNEELRRMGIKLIPMPETVDSWRDGML